MTLSIILSFILVASALVLSFNRLNQCSQQTGMWWRVSLITCFTGSCAIMILILGGHTPHWSFILLLVALVSLLRGDRRSKEVLSPH